MYLTKPSFLHGDSPYYNTNNSLAKAPVLFIKKKRLSIYINYRGLNNITKKNLYHLLLIKETLNGISKVKYFIKLNIKAVFYNIRITKG